MRRSDAPQRTRAARNSSVVSSPLLFIRVLGSSLFSSGTSHSLVLDVFTFYGRPVSCLRSAAGTKLEMGCNLAAHPGKQRHPTCLDITLQLQSSALQPLTKASGLGANGRGRGEVPQPLRGAGDSSSSHPAPSAPAAAITMLPRGDMQPPLPPT